MPQEKISSRHEDNQNEQIETFLVALLQTLFLIFCISILSLSSGAGSGPDIGDHRQPYFSLVRLSYQLSVAH